MLGVTAKIEQVLKRATHKLTSEQVYKRVKGCRYSSKRGRLSDLVRKGRVNLQDGLYWIDN